MENIPERPNAWGLALGVAVALSPLGIVAVRIASGVGIPEWIVFWIYVGAVFVVWVWAVWEYIVKDKVKDAVKDIVKDAVSELLKSTRERP
jgi:hypothetical protein